ncbi:MAG: hypothetical protein WC498_03400 [Candidatus Saccharimonadales bacterium]
MTPTLAASVTSFKTTTTPKTIAATWAAGDLLIVLGVTPSNVAGQTITTPTVTGLTFTPIDLEDTTGGHCWTGSWQATATSSGSGNISADRGATVAAWGFALIIASAGTHSGVGVHTIATSTVQTAALTLAGPYSAVCELIGDSGTGTSTVTLVPSGGTQPAGGTGSLAATYTFITITWTNQAAGTTSYGVSATPSGGQYSKILVEIKGIATATTAWLGA